VESTDIIIRDNGKGTCMLIDVAVSGERNVIRKVAEKILKNKYLTIEIQRMWNVKTKVILVKRGRTGTILKPFRKYVRKYQETMKSKTTENKHIGHYAHTSEIIYVKFQ